MQLEAKRILPSAAIRKRIHFGDWPVYCCFTATNQDIGELLLGHFGERIPVP
jgi:hypothetical protein